MGRPGKLPSWYRRGGCGSKKKGGEAHLSGADGVVGIPKRFVMRDHPVRSIKGGFAASLLMSRPPLLYQEGSCEPPSFGNAG